MIWQQLPNALTIFRILLVGPFAVALFRGAHELALLFIIVATSTDAVDGYLARRFNWTTRLGAVLDPLADKLLLTTSFVSLAVLGHIPMWLASIVVLRDVVIVVGAVSYHLTVEKLSIRPVALSKLNTLLQAALVVVVIAGLAGVPWPAWLFTVLAWAVAFTTVTSGLQYVLIGMKGALHKWTGRSA